MTLNQLNAKLEKEPILRVALAAHLRLAVRARVDSWDCLSAIDALLDQDGTSFSDTIGEMVTTLATGFHDVREVATISDEKALDFLRAACSDALTPAQ